MFADEKPWLVKEGTPIKAVGTRELSNLTKDKVYNALHGAEEGIFHTRPFVTVIDDTGERYSCHLSRFHLVEA